MLRGVSDVGRRGIVGRGQMVFAVLQFVDQGEFCLAQAARRLHDGVEDRLKLDCGSINGVQDLAGSFLPLSSASASSRLSLEISFFYVNVRKRTFSLRRRFASRWCPRTDFLRFIIECAPAGESFKNRLNINAKPIQLGDGRTVSHATETSVSGTKRTSGDVRVEFAFSIYQCD